MQVSDIELIFDFTNVIGEIGSLAGTSRRRGL